MSRLIRVFAAAFAIVALLIGVPLVLVRVAGWPLPTKMPDLSNAATMLEQGNVEASTVIKILACVVWAAWLFVAWAVVWEIVVNVPRMFTGGGHAPAPLAPAPISKGVGWLFAVLLATSAMSQTAAAAPSLGSLVEADDAGLTELIADDSETTSTPLLGTAPRQAVFDQYDAPATEGWLTVDDDSLWSISQESGITIDDIVSANPGLDAASFLDSGMVISLPEGAEIPLDRRVGNEDPVVDIDAEAVASLGATVYVVQPNDGWRNVAKALLDDPELHVEMQQRAIGQEVAPGVVFTADMAVIHPGWVFTADGSTVADSDDTPVRGIHVVMEGESLSSIAEDELGDQDRWVELWDLNANETMDDGRVFEDPNLILPGWTLDVAEDTTTSAIEVTPAEEVPSPVEVPAVEAPVDESPVVVEAPVLEEPTVEAPVVDDTSAPSVDAELPAPTASDVRVSDVDDVLAPPVSATTTPAAAPTPAPPADGAATEVGRSGMASVRDVRPVWLAGITGAVALSTALWLLVRSRRRRSAVRGGGRAADYGYPSMMLDEALRASADPDLIDWANEELSDLVAAYGVNENRSLPVVVELSREDGLTVHWEPPHGDQPSDWTLNEDGTSWSLPFDTNHVEGGGAPAGMPGLVTVGARRGHHVLLDIESCGSISVRGDMTEAEALVRSMVLELGAGGALSNAHVHTVGLDIDGCEHLSRVHVRSEGDAIEHLRSIRVQHDQVLNDSGRASMLEVRSASTPAGREITVVAVRASSCVRLDELIESAGPQRGVTVIVVGDADCSSTIEVDRTGTAHIEPLGITVGANGVSRQLASTLAVHLDRLNASIDADEVVVPAAVESGGSDPLVDPTRLVRVLGTPSVDGDVSFAFNETELIVFVASNNGTVTDDEIADDMSSGRMKRSDVWSVVSGIRAADGELIAAREEGGNTVALGAGCMTDVDWMSRLAFRSHTRDDSDAVDDLIEALDLVDGSPFDTTAGFGWATTSGAFGRALQMVERTGYLLACRAISAERCGDGADALRRVIDKVGPNEPLTQALMRLEREGGNDGGAVAAYGDFSRELVFLSEGPEPMRPSSGTMTLLDPEVEVIALEVGVEPIADAVDDEAVMEVARETVRPVIVLRTFGDICAEGASKTQALAVPFAVAAQGRAMTGEELAEVTGYSTKTMSTAFTTDHEILERKDGELSLRDGVWTDHRWMRECARRASEADNAGDVHEVADWLHTLFAEVNRIDGGAFMKVPGKKSYWSWIDDFPADVTARASAENEMVDAVLVGIDVWTNAGADDQIPAEVVVRAACNLAKLAPHAAVAKYLRPSDARSGGECLLRAAHGVAVGRIELTHTVVSTAQQMVAKDLIEASDDLADALGL